MERKLVNLALIAALAEQVACNTIKPIHIESTESPTPITQIVPTLTPFQPPMTETPTDAPSPTETATPVTLADRFKFGSFDVGDTPFAIHTTSPLMKVLGYIDRSPRKYTVDRPNKIVLPYIGDAIGQEFDSAATDNKSGNPSFVILTDRPNILLEYFHSMEPGAPGEPVRIIGSFLLKNPDKENEIAGKELTITPKGTDPITATIVSVKTVPEEVFNDTVTNESLWGIYPERDNIIFLRTDRAGVPESAIKDKTPGVYYLILASCTPKDGDYWVDPLNLIHTNHQLSIHNTANRTILTLRFVIP